MIHLLLLLSAQLSTEISLDFLAESDSEWVAPGWEVFEEIEIRPLDFVEPLFRSPVNIGCEVFEVQTEDGSNTWRLVICGSDRLVVFQGDWQTPRELEFPFPSPGVVLSQNGRYAFVRGYGKYGMDTGVLADIDEFQLGEVFVRNWEESFAAPGTYFVSNLGEVALFFQFEVGPIVLADSSGRFPDGDWEDILGLWAPVLSPEGDCFYARFQVGLGDFQSDNLGAFSLEGNLLWSFHGGGGMVSPDGSIVFGSRRGKTYALSAEDGRILWCYKYGDGTHGSSCTYDNRPMLDLVSGQDDGIGIVFRPVDRETSQERLDVTVSSAAFFWRGVSHSGHMLGEIFGQNWPGEGSGAWLEKLVILSPEGQPIWASELVGDDDLELGFSGNSGSDPYGTSLPYAIVGSGDSIYVISAPRQVSIHGIRRVP
jgi:hypothetical protein